MTVALTPALALAWLDELTVDVRAAVVLGGDGDVLAGDPGLAPRARELLASPAAPGTTFAEPIRSASVADGTLLVARAGGGAAIAVVAGPRVLLSLLGHDLARLSAGLADASGARD